MNRTTVRVSDATGPAASSFSLKQIAAACLLSAVIAGAVTALTSESSAGNAPASLFSINRADKTDRLPPAPVARPQSDATSTPAVRLEGRVPVGCDRAFSPVADPARANFVRNCLT
jgi:hypothetical protein